MDKQTIHFTKDIHQELTNCCAQDNNRHDLSQESCDAINKYMYQNSILRRHTPIYITEQDSYSVPITEEDHIYWLNDYNRQNISTLRTKAVDTKSLLYSFQINYKDLDKKISVCNFLENHILPRFVLEEDKAFLYGSGEDKPQGIIKQIDNEFANTLLEITEQDDIVHKFHEALRKLPADHVQGAIIIANPILIERMYQIYKNNLDWLLNKHITYLGHTVIQTQLLQSEHLAVIFNPYKSYKIVDSSKITVCRSQNNSPHLNLQIIKSTASFVVDYKNIILLKQS